MTTKTIIRKGQARKKTELNELAKELVMTFNESLARGFHYTVLADILLKLKNASGFSERDLSAVVDLSKSELHRMLHIGKLDQEMKQAAFEYNVEKYVLLEWNDCHNGDLSERAYYEIILGNIRTRKQLKKFLKVH